MSTPDEQAMAKKAATSTLQPLAEVTQRIEEAQLRLVNTIESMKREFPFDTSSGQEDSVEESESVATITVAYLAEALPNVPTHAPGSTIPASASATSAAPVQQPSTSASASTPVPVPKKDSASRSRRKRNRFFRNLEEKTQTAAREHVASISHTFTPAQIKAILAKEKIQLKLASIYRQVDFLNFLGDMDPKIDIVFKDGKPVGAESYMDGGKLSEQDERVVTEMMAAWVVFENACRELAEYEFAEKE
ncbi:hypothetical protein E8E13_006181 [Curvularia kusanoi]|uniref:Uncharacterized protein n=1 Tax=Curvularia kusanoi TaxID=90978 RepID=A0A9P4W5W2_CURKU|nr:hypothetical protein E8E13_006181 [Curvularia kusanoi]